MTKKIPTISVSKIDAAKRQLETAITLYFHDADPVSTHTLAAAAHNVLHALCKSQGIKSMIKDNDMIREGKKGAYLKYINAAQNFFKHGSRDLNKLCVFSPASTECLILDACQMYQRITTEYPKPFKIFYWWFTIQYPELLKEGVSKQAAGVASELLNAKERTAFYRVASGAYDLLRFQN